MAIGNLSRRGVALFGLAGLLLYATWIGWPYLHAIVVRDAAVTTWISVISAPIAGYTTDPLHPGERAGADGRIATITDVGAQNLDSTRAESEVARAQARVAAQTAVVDATRHALDVRAEHAGEFAATFSRDLEAAVNGEEKSLSFLLKRLELERAEATRLASLKQGGLTSQSALDNAHSSVAEVQRQIATTQASLDRDRGRLAAAKRGVFLLEDGTDGNSVTQNLADARLRLLQAEEALGELRAEQEAAQHAFDKSRALEVKVKPGAMVWSLISSPGGPVQPGTPLASWVDCSVMLVDVPVSDVEGALLRKGSVAHVVLEGEREVREGRVMLTRGAAGTLGDRDLAALAKGRRHGIGQALVELQARPADIEACLIGHAAYVDFPEVGVLDLLRARLRL